MRIPVAVSLESRDGSVSKDAKIVNGVVEARGDQPVLRKRPGFADLGLINASSAQLLYTWNGINAIVGDTLYRGTAASVVSSPASTTAISPNVAGLRFDAQEVGASAATQLMMIKNRTQAWTINGAGAKSSISFPSNMGAASYSVASLTRSGTTATASLSTDPGLKVGDSVTVSGAGQAAYNITASLTGSTPYSFTPAQDVSISITRSSTTATATSVDPHGLTTGVSYTVSGASDSAYNGSYVVTVTSATTFTYTITVTSYTAYGSSVTWNPSDKDASVTLSGGNTNASITTTSSTRGAVRATTGKSTGKWQWEMLVTAAGGFPCIGVANSTFPLTNYVGQDTNSWGYASSGSIVHIGGGSIVPSYTTGDVIGVVLDMDLGTVSFYKNGSLQGILTGLTGTIFPAFSSGPSSATSSVTTNFGLHGFVYDYSAPASPASGTPIVTRAAVTIDATVSYTVAGSPVTPATGTITLTTNGGMVPGLPYIDGYFFVMDNNGVMWASAIDDPTSWPALNNLTAQNENGKGKALYKSQNYLVALKEWSTEFFYDAKQTLFPFLPVDNGFTQIGCASGESVARIDGNLIWISQVKERGRSVHLMVGTQQQQVSTPDVERILNQDDLATVYAYGIKIGGHSLYVVTLVTSNLTLVYDLASQSWTQWTSLTLGSSVSVSSVTFASGIATVTTSTAHGLSDGGPVKISGANQAEYNGIFQASVTSSTVFTIEVSGSPATGTGTILAFPYTSSYFKLSKYCDYLGLDLFLHETSGHLFQMLPTLYQDGAVPIDLMFRTTRLDMGTSEVKVISRLSVIGDVIPDTMSIRQSDDDCATFSPYRSVDLSLERPTLRRLGKFRRRTIEGRHIGNTTPRIEGLEIDI